MCALRIKKRQGISGISSLGNKKVKITLTEKGNENFTGVLGKNEQIIVLDSSISSRGQTWVREVTTAENEMMATKSMAWGGLWAEHAE